MSDETRGLVPREPRYYVLAEGALDVPAMAIVLGHQLDQAMAEGELDRALELAEAELKEIREAEIREDRRLHKGHPLYNMPSRSAAP